MLRGYYSTEEADSKLQEHSASLEGSPRPFGLEHALLMPGKVPLFGQLGETTRRRLALVTCRGIELRHSLQSKREQNIYVRLDVVTHSRKRYRIELEILE